MNGSKEMESKASKKLVLTFVLVLFLIIIASATVLYYFQARGGADPEVITGAVIVLSIVTLMTVLFILAAGFSAMGLTDPKQALGLPEGSIRAMIALVLIMVFIIFGVLLFRKVALPDKTYLGQAKNLGDARVPEGVKMPYVVLYEALTVEDKYESDKKTPKTDNNYYVYIAAEASEEGKRLAQQLITTVGTLVVAIASFYFGTTMASSGAKKEREEILAAQTVPAVSNPVIKDITPKEGEKGQEIPMEIVGTDFKAPRMVQLLRGSEAMVGTEVLSNPTKIQCKVMIDKEPDGKWDVIVLNEDGKQARLAEVFVIKHT